MSNAFFNTLFLLYPALVLILAGWAISRERRDRD